MSRGVTTLYGIANCDTVKRARSWLTAQGIDCRFHDFKREGVPAGHLDRWLAEAGIERLVNRRGTAWRKLDEVARSGIVDAPSARALLLAQPSVIKRPVLHWPDGSVTVGFDADAWAARLAGALRR